MRNVTPLGVHKDIVLVPNRHERDWLRPDRFVRAGVSVETFRRMARLSLATAIAQYYGNVQAGFAEATTMHLFRGLERPLMHDGNMQADQDMLIYTWAATLDWEWNWKTQTPEPRKPPKGKVFKVVVRPYAESDENEVMGVILHWAWDEEDPVLRGAPINWEERYAEKIWSRRRQ